MSCQSEDRNSYRTYRDEVLFHKGREHVVPDGGHDVAEVHGGNDAVLLFVLLRKRLARVLQLQLLSNKTRGREAEPKPGGAEDGRSSAAYLQELGELQVAEVLLIILPKVQTDELAVPLEGDVVVHCGLAEDVPHIFCSTNEMNDIRGKRWIFQTTAGTQSSRSHAAHA